jgi:inner membrane protein involved in colicin E2 resistance
MTDQLLGRIDKAGMIASTVCAVHCIVSPTLLVVISIHRLRSHLNEEAEWLFVGVSLALGTASLLPSYVRVHRRSTALVVFLAGVTTILFGRLLVPAGDIEAVLVVIGASMIIAAHATNRFLCRTCPRCSRSRNAAAD